MVDNFLNLTFPDLVMLTTFLAPILLLSVVVVVDQVDSYRHESFMKKFRQEL